MNNTHYTYEYTGSITHPSNKYTTEEQYTNPIKIQMLQFKQINYYVVILGKTTNCMDFMTE